MEQNLNWKESLEMDDSIKRFEYRDYEPFTGTNLNKFADIRISIQNQDEFLLPYRSYIYIEGSLKKWKTDQNLRKINLGLELEH